MDAKLDVHDYAERSQLICCFRVLTLSQVSISVVSRGLQRTIDFDNVTWISQMSYRIAPLIQISASISEVLLRSQKILQASQVKKPGYTRLKSGSRYQIGNPSEKNKYLNW